MPAIDMTVNIHPTPEEWKAALEDAKRAALERALTDRVVPSEEEAVVRDLIPSDIMDDSAKKWEQTISTEGDWNRVTPSGGKKAEDKVVAIVGLKFRNPEPKVNAIRFTEGPNDTAVKAQFFFEGALGNDNPEVLFNSLVMYKKGAQFNVYLQGIKTGTDNVVLVGVVVEPAGKWVSPPKG